METTKLDRLIKSQIENLESKITDLNKEYDTVFRLAINTKDKETESKCLLLMRMLADSEITAKLMLKNLQDYIDNKDLLSKIYSHAMAYKENI
jgi:archaellum component FlaC